MSEKVTIGWHDHGKTKLKTRNLHVMTRDPCCIGDGLMTSVTRITLILNQGNDIFVIGSTFLILPGRTSDTGTRNDMTIFTRMTLILNHDSDICIASNIFSICTSHHFCLNYW